MLGVTGVVAALVTSPAVADPRAFGVATRAAAVPAQALGAQRTTSAATEPAAIAPAAKAPVQRAYGVMAFSVVAKPKPKPTPKPKPRPAPALASTVSQASRSSSRVPTTYHGSGVGLAGLTANARLVLNGVTSAFPQITDIIGVRPDSLPDHPSGHAIDFMIPDPFSSSGIALGDDVVALVQAHAGDWHVEYLIYRQRIWFPSSGWRAMEDRGSPTANHMDHVHVTVY